MKVYFVAVLLWMLGTAISGVAQDGVITGRVADASDAILPGVGVTLTSAQVMGERTQVTDERGTYRFILLPPGAYKLKFELPGFATLVRDGVQITAGFTATISVTLQVATSTETVTVMGTSPIVDLENATVATNFTAAITNVLPAKQDWGAVVGLAPGITVATPDVGGSRAHLVPSSLKSFGTSGQIWILMDGVISESISYWSFDALSEFQVTGANQSAEVPTSGASMNFIVKSGGNGLHGGLYADWINKNFQSSNLDAGLIKQGVTTLTVRDRWNDFHGDLGGPFKKDKFWWYTAGGYQYDALLPFGFKNDDGSQATYSVPFKRLNLKFDYQLTPKNTLTYSGAGVQKYHHQRIDIGAAKYMAPEAAGISNYRHWAQKWQLTTILSPRVTLETKVGNYGLIYPRVSANTKVSMRDLDTLQIRGGYSGSDAERSGEGFSGITIPYVTRYRKWQADGVLAVNTSALLTGNHNVKVGYGYLFDGQTTTDYGFAANVITFWRGGFKTPAFIQTYDTPYITKDIFHQSWLFANDTWNLNRKLTLNLGFRYEGYVPHLAAQGKSGSGPYQQAFTVADTYLKRLNGPVPRLSAVYDVFGNGRTAMRAGFAKYVLLANPEAMVNPNGSNTNRYNWNGAGFDRISETFTTPYVPIPANIVSSSTAVNRTLDPNLHFPHVDEYTAGIDQEISKGMVLRFNFVRKFERDHWQTFNTSIPYSAYNIPVTFTDPGRDGLIGSADDRQITVYSVDPKFRGLSTQVLANNPHSFATFTTYQIEAVKRLADKWQLVSGLEWLQTKATNDAQDPTTGINGEQNYWTWQFRTVGSYELPRRITASAALRASQGAAQSRTLNTPSLNQGVVVINAEPIGALRYPNYGLLDLKFQKTFTLGDRGSLSAMVDLFNVNNSNAVLTRSNLTGVTFLSVSQVMDPRIFRLGLNYKF